MHILGSLIKGVIEVADKITGEDNPAQEQEQVLKALLKKAADTKFGKHYGFNGLLEAENVHEAYARNIPYFDYNRINEQWWSRLHEGESDVTWPGDSDYFALSSGTTGKTSKRIPVTAEMIEAIRSAGIKQVLALNNFELPPNFFEKGILMLGSSTDLTEKDGHLEGEISGISASNIPGWFRGLLQTWKRNFGNR